MEKHPKRYQELFALENHWLLNRGLWVNLMRGAKKYGIEIPWTCWIASLKKGRRLVGALSFHESFAFRTSRA
jgi:hypothetical protein